MTTTPVTRWIGPAGGGDPLGQRFEQRQPAGLDDLDDLAGQPVVVNGVRQHVAAAGRSQIDRELDVDLERLRPPLLLRQDAVGSERPNTATA